jgi:hypothetical protein
MGRPMLIAAMLTFYAVAWVIDTMIRPTQPTR